MIEPIDALTRRTSNDKNTMAKVAGRGVCKSKHSSFEWIQLIATICIPIIIAIYTFIDNGKKESIADADRRKDMVIAEENRQKDRDLALDQQRENILAQYQAFMANLLMENGITLNGTPTAKTVATSMILTTLSQLDARRKGILIRSLYHSKLITLRRDSDPVYDTCILPLYFIDLRHITFGTPRDSPADVPRPLFIDWYYIWLPHAILTNTSFRHTGLTCATFLWSYMEFVDMSFAAPGDITCFNGTIRAGQVTFGGSRLMNASFYKAEFRFTVFDGANLTFANMREFYCIECSFWSATLAQADLSFSKIYTAFNFYLSGSPFDSTNLRQAVMHAARFLSVSFFRSDWSNVQASQIDLRNCSFINAVMEHSSLTKSFIRLSLFQNASLLNIDLSDATLNNVSFIDTDMRNANMSSTECNYCKFINVKLQGAVLKNASLRYATFLNCQIDENQLQQAFDLSGSTLPNGIVVKSNE